MVGSNGRERRCGEFKHFNAEEIREGSKGSSLVFSVMGCGCSPICTFFPLTSEFELLLTRGIRLFNKNKALRNVFGL